MPDPIPRGPFDQGLFLAHLNKGRELFQARKFEDAERQLEEAYLLRPRDPRVLNLLGLVYFRAKKLDKAEEVYRKLATESPEAHALHYNLGLICFKLGRLDDAEQAFLRALDLSPGSPKLHFYLGSVYERLHRHKDAIHHYRHAGAHMLVKRVEGKLSSPFESASARATSADSTAPPGALKPATRPLVAAAPLDADPDTDPGTTPPQPAPALAAPPAPAKEHQPLSSSLLADGSPLPGLSETARFQVYDDTLPPVTRARLASAQATEARPAGPRRELFRGIEKGLMEVDFSGKVFIKQGTIYSYSGNLTFWVKDKRPAGRPALVIVTGAGRMLLTDQDREITFMQVIDEPIFVEPGHLLACEEGLAPRSVHLSEDEQAIEVIALEGRGMVALSVASKPLPLTVRPGQPVSVPAPSVVMWTGSLTAHVVDDPRVYEVVVHRQASGSGRLLRLEGTGRVLVEQTTP